MTNSRASTLKAHGASSASSVDSLISVNPSSARSINHHPSSSNNSIEYSLSLPEDIATTLALLVVTAKTSSNILLHEAHTVLRPQMSLNFSSTLEWEMFVLTIVASTGSKSGKNPPNSKPSRKKSLRSSTHVKNFHRQAKSINMSLRLRRWNRQRF